MEKTSFKQWFYKILHFSDRLFITFQTDVNYVDNKLAF